MTVLTDSEWNDLKGKLIAAGRLNEFKLGVAEKEYIASRGLDILGLHTVDFIKKRIAPAKPKNDGRQTPAKGHPVFIAQHAMGCDDRSSLEQFYGIEKGVELSDAQVDLLAGSILRWINEQL